VIRRARYFVVRLTSATGGVFFVSPNRSPVVSCADAMRFQSRAEAQSMGEHLCGVAANKGDASWTSSVQLLLETLEVL
jgi:hypothetical protein